MAALWTQTGRAGTSGTRSCAILTTAANEVVREIHDRMPVILQPQLERAWLSHELDDEIDQLRQLLTPQPAAEFCVRRVSEAVNSARYDTPELIQAYEDPQLGLF